VASLPALCTTKKRPVKSAIKIDPSTKKKKEREGRKTDGRSSEDQLTHCVDPKAGLRGDHEHASRLRMDVVARVLGHEHPNVLDGWVNFFLKSHGFAKGAAYSENLTKALARPTCLSILSRETARSRDA